MKLDTIVLLAALVGALLAGALGWFDAWCLAHENRHLHAIIDAQTDPEENL